MKLFEDMAAVISEQARLLTSRERQLCRARAYHVEIEAERDAAKAERDALALQLQELASKATDIADRAWEQSDQHKEASEALDAARAQDREEIERLRAAVCENAATIRRQRDELAAVAARAADGVNVRQALRRAGDELARRLAEDDGDDRADVIAMQAWTEAKAGATDDQPEPAPAA